MISSDLSNDQGEGVKEFLSIFSFNANKNYAYVETLLVTLSLNKKMDIILLQKPP
jgi:hypothetical protein